MYVCGKNAGPSSGILREALHGLLPVSAVYFQFGKLVGSTEESTMYNNTWVQCSAAPAQQRQKAAHFCLHCLLLYCPRSREGLICNHQHSKGCQITVRTEGGPIVYKRGKRNALAIVGIASYITVVPAVKMSTIDLAPVIAAS